MKVHTLFVSHSILGLGLGLMLSTPVLQAADAAKDAPKAPVKETAADPKPATDAPAKARQPKVEIIFVLDTTGSMSGLIEGAKQKIWAIANDVISAKPKPQVRFGLVGYRDRGDAYVTKRAELSDDLDGIYARLQEFKADGGGDTPESVSEALHEAVTKMPWSTGDEVLKIIYLVGDAPPQSYQDGKDWKKVCQKASAASILINTIQCGNIAGTAEVWKAIASRGAGAYAVIPQDGNMVTIAAPQDEELLKLNVEVGQTLIPYGSKDLREEVSSKQKTAEAASPGANAFRLSYNWKSEKTVQGEGDLIDSLNGNKVDLEKIPAAELPEELRDLKPEELKAHVEKQQAKRSEIQSRIAVLVQEREAFLKAERQKASSFSKADSFDEQVAQSLRQQAAPKGLVWEK